MNCRIKIFIKGKPVLQGKYYELNGKPTFLFNVDSNKWMRNYAGYGVAEQIFEGFEKLKLHGVQVIAKNTETHINYIAPKSLFYKKGIKDFVGGHDQWFLPLKNWEVFRDSLEEPYGLPSLTVAEWIIRSKEEEQNEGVTKEDYIKNMSKLGEIFRSKYAV